MAIGANVSKYAPIGDLLSMSGSTAVVTGAGRGIGAAIARRFGEAGARVIVIDKNGAAAKKTVEELSQGSSGTFESLEVDVSDPSKLQTAIKSIAANDTIAPLRVWVNNAGIFPNQPINEIDVADWDRVLDVNLRAAFFAARGVAGVLVERNQPGVIINIASTAGYHARGIGLAHYVASKHGVIGLTKALAVELGPHGIRVLGIAPVVTSTPGIRENLEQYVASGMGDRLSSLWKTLPIRRSVEPDDIARVALFCASDLSAVMTGSTLLADGGDVAR